MILSERGRPLIFRFEAEVLFPLMARGHNQAIMEARAALELLDPKIKIPTLSEAKGTLWGMSEDYRFGYPNDLLVTSPGYVRLCDQVVNASDKLIDMDKLKLDLEEYDKV